MTNRIIFPLKIHFLFCILFSLEYSELNAQIVNGNGYLMGQHVEVGIDGSAGHEGTLDVPGSHARGGNPEVPLGFVADPIKSNWGNYNGDYFTSGSPENGFGLEINGTNYSNNAWNAVTVSSYLQEIPKAPGTSIQYSNNEDCHSVEWEGFVSGVRINVKYILGESHIFYTTEVTLTNESGSDLTDLYYYRTVDPDNNQSLGGSFKTTNTIVNQPTPNCNKALVSATQRPPYSSYLGLGALGEKFRVSHGGQGNRDASNIWNGVGGSENMEGAVTEDKDESISLAYKTDLAAGASETFKYAVVLDQDEVEAAIASLYFISYETGLGESGGIASTTCSESLIIVSCRGGSWVELNINGPNLDDYAWQWKNGERGLNTRLDIDESEDFWVIGNPLGTCLIEQIRKQASIVFNKGPKIEFREEGPICGSIGLDEVAWESSGDVPTGCVFLTEEPDSANQIDPKFDKTIIEKKDEVWLLCKDDATGCYDYDLIFFNFAGEKSAGADTTDTICSGLSRSVDLEDYVSDTASQNGYFLFFKDLIYSPMSSERFSTVGFEGDYYYYYVVPGLGVCPADTAEIHLFFEKAPLANFEFEVNGVSSADALLSACVTGSFDFINLSSTQSPGTIDSYVWDFGDGNRSDIENPSHLYSAIGDYLVTLAVVSSNECRALRAKIIRGYREPPMEVLYSSPICFDSKDGSIIVEPEIIEPYTVEIRNELDELINMDDAEVLGLDEGIFYIQLIDASGCINYDTVTLIKPPILDVFFRSNNILCEGDSGWVKVDSVVGESFNNPIQYDWSPDPAGVSGLTAEADSSYWMTPGDYTLRVTDQDGCSNTISFEFINPPTFSFSEIGWDTAFCRQSNLQNGGGAIWADVKGGVPEYDYLWTNLGDASVFNGSKWSDVPGGDYSIKVTDSKGCVLVQTITVDSLNPIASFVVVSNDLDSMCRGTADLAVEFVNTSRYFAGPTQDTTFNWNLNSVENNWEVTNSYSYKPDTIYEVRGDSYKIDVCLIAFNSNGCSNMVCKKITIFEPPEIKPPNVFTPNNSGENDVFTFDYLSKGIQYFECTIANRWGKIVGKINSIASSWDGTNINNGKKCVDGVYFYTYVGIGDNEQVLTGQGTVTIIDSGVEE